MADSEMKKRVLLVVAYDGTNYAGFQYQKSGVPTIEGELNKAISELTREEVSVIGASRTDTGVHALCNMAVFDTQSRIPGEKFAYALNIRLPEDIRVQFSKDVPVSFHPRHCSTVKTYEYHIYNAVQPTPAKSRFCYFSYTPFDVDKMREGAVYLVGEHDFKSFCSIYTQALTTVREITAIEIEEKRMQSRGILQKLQGEEYAAHPERMNLSEMMPREIIIRVSGTGFLYNMVRIIAGTLMEVGRGKNAPEEIKEILEACDRSLAGPTAPPEGLMLTSYEILDEIV